MVAASKHPTADRVLTGEERKRAATEERQRWAGKIAGGKVRADMVPRDLLKVIPFAVAAKILIDVLNGEIKIRTATEAAQIAKVAVEIGRVEMGESTSAEPLTADERQARIKEAGILMDEIRARREILIAEEAGIAEPEAPVVEDAPREQTA